MLFNSLRRTAVPRPKVKPTIRLAQKTYRNLPKMLNTVALCSSTSLPRACREHASHIVLHNACLSFNQTHSRLELVPGFHSCNILLRSAKPDIRCLPLKITECGDKDSNIAGCQLLCAKLTAIAVLVCAVAMKWALCKRCIM